MIGLGQGVGARPQIGDRIRAVGGGGQVARDRAAQIVGEAVRKVYDIHGEAMRAQHVGFDVALLLAGQIKGRSSRLFQIYSAGNFIEATEDTPYFQIGEHKYGKPILDRVSQGTMRLGEAAKLILLSFDSIASLFKERASFNQPYDSGRFGRFGRHILGAGMALDYPVGIGPLQFRRFFPEDTHNSFLNAFMSGGWISGILGDLDQTKWAITDEGEAMNVSALAATVPTHLWQHHAAVDEHDVFSDATRTNTKVVDGACIFLNRPGFSGGTGCALHLAAVEYGESPTDWKPSVCWQLPIRVDWQMQSNGVEHATVRRWSRADWGDEGTTMAWCCTVDRDHADAFVGDEPVIEALGHELDELVGHRPLGIDPQVGATGGGEGLERLHRTDEFLQVVQAARRFRRLVGLQHVGIAAFIQHHYDECACVACSLEFDGFVFFRSCNHMSGCINQNSWERIG